MKLELKHLAPYLPYDIDIKLGHTIRDLTAVSLDSTFVFVTAQKGARERHMAGMESIKPILRPLSDFTEDDISKVRIDTGEEEWCELYEEFFDIWFDINYTERIYGLMLQCPYEIVQWFLKNHYDVFGLIENDLAIDKNTIE